MKGILEFFADRPELLVPALVLAEITLIGGLALVICRAWRNDAATRYGVALTATIMIWLTIPATLLLRAQGYETLSWSQKLYTEPIPLSLLENLPPAEPEPPSRPSPIVLLWGAGTAIVLARFGVGLLRVRRLKRTAEPLPHLTGAAPVYVTEQVPGPVVIGALRPSVLIPASIVDGLSETELHDVLAHEFAHVARRHLLVAVIQRLTVALFWPHPFVHLLSRQMTEAREEVCDNVVLGVAGRARYARVLLRVAECRRSTGHFSASLGLFSLESNLEERVKSLLDPHRRISTEMNYRSISLVSALLLLGVAGIAGARVQTELVAVPAYDGLQAEPPHAPAKNKVKPTKNKSKSKSKAERLRLKAALEAKLDKQIAEKAMLRAKLEAQKTTRLDIERAKEEARDAMAKERLDRATAQEDMEVAKRVQEKMVRDQIQELARARRDQDAVSEKRIHDIAIRDEAARVQTEAELDKSRAIAARQNQQVKEILETRDTLKRFAQNDDQKLSQLREALKKMGGQNDDLKGMIEEIRREMAHIEEGLRKLEEELRKRGGGNPQSLSIDDPNTRVPILSDLPILGRLFQMGRQPLKPSTMTLLRLDRSRSGKLDPLLPLRTNLKLRLDKRGHDPLMPLPTDRKKGTDPLRVTL